MLLENHTIEVTPPECLPSEVFVTATFEFADDLTDLLPYLNAELGPCVYDTDVPFLRVRRDGKLVAIFPREIRMAGLQDEEEAKEVFRWLRETINSVADRKDDITPSTRSLSELKPLEMFKLLPRTNCGACPQKTCMAFAAAIAGGQAAPEDCPPLLEDGAREQRSRLSELLGELRGKK